MKITSVSMPQDLHDWVASEARAATEATGTKVSVSAVVVRELRTAMERGRKRAQATTKRTARRA